MTTFAELVAALIGLRVSSTDGVTMWILTVLLDACILALWCRAVYLGLVSLIEQGRTVGRAFGLIWSWIGFVSVFLLAFMLRTWRKEPKWLGVQCLEVLVAAATALTWSGYTGAKWDTLCHAARRIFSRTQHGEPTGPILPTTTTMVSVTTTSHSDPEAASIHGAIADAITAIVRLGNIVATPSPDISCDLFSSRTTHFVISTSLTDDVSDYCLPSLYS